MFENSDVDIILILFLNTHSTHFKLAFSNAEQIFTFPVNHLPPDLYELFAWMTVISPSRVNT
jgi:hypothetical protein